MRKLLLLCLCFMLVACSKSEYVMESKMVDESFYSDKNIVFNSNDEVLFKQYGSKEMIVLNYEAKEKLKELSEDLLLLKTSKGNVVHDNNSIEVKINGKETYYFRGNTIYHEINENFDGEQVVVVLNSDELYDFALEVIGINEVGDVEPLLVDEYHDGYLDSENPIKHGMYQTLTNRFMELEEYLIKAYEELVNESKVFNNVNEEYQLEMWNEIFEYPFNTLIKYAYSNNDMIKVIVTCSYENDDTSCEYQALINEDVFKEYENVVTNSVELVEFYERTIINLANGIIDEESIVLGEENDGYIKVDMLFDEELRTSQDIYDYLHQFFSSEKSKKLCDMLVNSDYIKFDDGIYLSNNITINNESRVEIKAYKIFETTEEQSFIGIVSCEYGYCEWKEYSYILENNLWLCD